MNKTTSVRFEGDELKNLKARLTDAVFLSFSKKAIESTGKVYTFVVSTPDLDRQGDELDQSKWDFTLFKMNPVALWSHEYANPPIGAWENIRQEGGKTLMDLRLVPKEVYPFAGQIEGMIELGFVKACSVGYMMREDGTMELLEVSPCSVGANAYALTQSDVKKYQLKVGELVNKGFSFVFNKEIMLLLKEEEPPVKKAEQIGDRCQMDDGGSGTLADDPENPGHLVCIPEDEDETVDKNNKDGKHMKEELEKKLKAEHERHGDAVDEHVNDLNKKAVEAKKKAAEEGNDNSEYEKAITEFEKAMDEEHDEHLEKCTAAIDDSWKLTDQHDGKAMGDEKEKKKFMKGIKAEHEKHVGEMEKCIEDFKSEVDGDPEQHEKCIDEFEKAVKPEMNRHGQVHEDMVKALPDPHDEGEEEDEKGIKGLVAEQFEENQEFEQKWQKMAKASDIFSAFVCAYMDDVVPVDDYEKLLDEMIAMLKGEASEKIVGVFMAKGFRLKAGRKISAATQKAIEAVIEKLGSHHKDLAEKAKGLGKDHEEATDKAIADLKAICAVSPGEGEDEDGKKGHRTPKAKVEIPTTASPSPMTEDFNSVMLAKKILGAVNTSSKEGLTKINEILDKHFGGRK